MEVERCALNVRNIEARLGKFLLGPISLTARLGEVTALIGPNGSGKTTLLRVIAGLLHHKGTLDLCGRRLPLAPGRGGIVEIVPAEPQGDPYARVWELFKVSGYSATKAVELVPKINDLLYRRLGSLSSGEQKLVCLLRGLISPRRILLLDEPLVHLDVAFQSLAISLIRRVAAEDKIVIVSLHELHLVGGLADKIILLSAGRKLLEINVHEAESHIGVIEKAYGVPMTVLKRGDDVIILPSPIQRGARTVES